MTDQVTLATVLKIILEKFWFWRKKLKYISFLSVHIKIGYFHPFASQQQIYLCFENYNLPHENHFSNFTTH